MTQPPHLQPTKMNPESILGASMHVQAKLSDCTEENKRDRRLTGGHLAILRCWTVWNDALHLQELVRFVSADDGEAEAHAALLQCGGQKCAFQLGGVSRERRLLCKCHIPNTLLTHATQTVRKMIIKYLSRARVISQPGF